MQQVAIYFPKRVIIVFSYNQHVKGLECLIELCVQLGGVRMKVNDGESGSSQELKPSANFCDAYLSYLSKNSVKLPSTTPTIAEKTSSDTADNRGVLCVGSGNSPGSKWTFYNRSSPQSTDLKVGGTRTRRTSDRFAARELSRGRGVLTKSANGQIIGKEQLRVQIEQLDLGKRGLSVNGKRVSTVRKELNTGRRELNTGRREVNKAGSKQRGKPLPVAQKQLKVSVELINLKDSFVKVGSEVIKVHKEPPSTSENGKPDRIELKPELSLSKEVQSKDSSLDQTGQTSLTEISVEPPSLNLQPLDQSSAEKTSSAELDCAEGDAGVSTKPSGLPAKNQSLSFGEYSCETIDASDASKDEKELSAGANDSKKFQLSADADKSLLIDEKSLDLSESLQVNADETCIELSDDGKSDEEVKESGADVVEKSDAHGRSPVGGVRCIRSNRSAGVKIPGRLAEGGERSKFSPRAFRKDYKNSWRRKIVKKHLVSEKRKTQATRLLNAERPKRNVVSKKTDGASIGLSRREEVELTRALYASLQTQRQKNKPAIEAAAIEYGVTETSRDGTSQALSLFGRPNTYPNEGFLITNNRLPGVQAQRKFASGPTNVGPVGFRKRGKRPGNILASKKARTEDFLTFLCLRERTVVPSLLDFIHGLQNVGSQSNVIKSNSSSTVTLQNGHDQHITDCNQTSSEMQPPRLPNPIKISSCEEIRLEEPVRNSPTHHTSSANPECTISGTNDESANDNSLIGQNSTTICESLALCSTPTPNLTVDLTPNPVSLQHTDSINNVDMSSPSKVQSSISVKSSSKIAASDLSQRKPELPRSSRLRPSTRALTAARADEQLMLAKQRLSPVASDGEEQTEMNNASDIKVDLSDTTENKEILNNALESKEDVNNILEDKDGLNRVEELMDIGSPVKMLSHVGFTGSSHTLGDEDRLESRQPSMDVEMEIDDCETSSKSSSCISERPAVVNGLNDCRSDDDEVKKHADPQSGYPDPPPQRRLLRARTGKKDLENSESPAEKGHARSLRMSSKSCSKDDSLVQEPIAASNSEGSEQLANNDKPVLGCHIPRIPLSISFFPSSDDPARIVNGPSYHPSEEQFEDPVQYIELIQMNAEPFGMCKVVPPDGWKVECCVRQELRFNTSIQYINRLRHRCGSNSFQMDCIKKHLDSQKIQMEQFPLLNGIQVDLVALSRAVKQCGGLQNVIDKNTWSKVAKIMHLPKCDKDKAQRLCQIYCRYLLSYDTLNEDENQKLAKQVTGRRQPNNYDPKAHCFAKGKTRTLGEFFNVARNITGLYFDQEPSTADVEAEYFRLLGECEKHVAVHMVHIDTDQCGSAFPDRKDSPYARHGWNFNVLRKNEGSLLNNLGRIEGVTSSVLHVGMLFSTSCWTRHRHYLPFIHYLHTGADIIWYCIPASEANKFRKFVENEIPNSKDLELGSEQSQIMVSPDELVLHGISVSRVVQRHGEYVVIFPEAFTAYVCSGYSISESMHFATPEWIIHGCKAIQVLREKSLPEMFSLTKVLFSVAFSSQLRPNVLEAALPHLQETINAELSLRKKVLQLGLNRTTVSHDEHVLCEICKTRCFLSAVVSEQDDVVYCLEHALSRLQKKKKVNSYKMLYQFEEKDLKHMMQKAAEISKKASEME